MKEDCDLAARQDARKKIERLLNFRQLAGKNRYQAIPPKRALLAGARELTAARLSSEQLAAHAAEAACGGADARAGKRATVGVAETARWGLGPA